MKINDLTYLIRGAAFRVHSVLGPGLFESAYQKALASELKLLGLEVETEVPLNLIYNNEDFGVCYKMDLVVNNMIVLELKSVNSLEPIHHKQLYSYLRLANKSCGLLINFNELNLQDGIFRQNNNK